jgi:hypothetical protein
MVSWARVCWPFNQGGLGIVDLERFGQAPLNQGGLGIVDLERFGQALQLRWLWLHWKSPTKPWHNSELCQF